MCPHTTMCSYYHTCVLILLSVCPHTSLRVLILYVASYYYLCPQTAFADIYVSSNYYIGVLILLYVCPHTTICVLIQVEMELLTAEEAAKRGAGEGQVC